MKIILGSRSSGKTKRLLELSAMNRVPILCETQARVERLLTKAKGYGYQIPLPVSLDQLDPKIKEVYVDEIDLVFEHLTKLKLGALTLNKDDKNEIEDLDK
ncbi:MAG: hypothetical protein WC196_01970 [Bacilli bacterium]|jgi:hypothetical protein|nr:hypothetical protein [Bacilli bacterium]MDD3422080.1 hypothetical protein [Bacilli bacterium]MDD4065595.1 hypothetical protein [Bacilli bacterium]